MTAAPQPAPMKLVAARDLVPAAPDGLEALLVCRRAAQGAVVRICAGGDVGPAGHLIAGGDPFREIAPVLRAADLSFANLETPLLQAVELEAARRGEPGEAQFLAPAAAAELLATAGFRLLNLANNHILDAGAGGLAETRHALETCGVKVLGAGPDGAAARRLVVTGSGEPRLGWLGSARTLEPQAARGDVFWEYDFEELADAVRAARPQVDVLIVSLHMGYMYVDYPQPEQRRQALELLAAGADLVLMHHAHVLQGLELAAGGMVCYNLGNLLLDWTLGDIPIEIMQEEQRSGGVFVFDLDRGGVCAAAVLPVRVDDGWTVRWALADQGRTILERLRRISGGWDGDAALRFQRQLADRVTGLAVKSTLLDLRRGGLKALPGLARRIKGRHLRMVAGWPAERLKRWLRARATSR